MPNSLFGIMATDKDNTKGHSTNLITPSKFTNGIINSNHNGEFNSNKRKFNFPNGNDENYIELLHQQLAEEKHNNKILRNQISEMHDQIAKLTETISELNQSISKLHLNKNEKNNKSKKKSSPKHQSKDAKLIQSQKGAQMNHHSNALTQKQENKNDTKATEQMDTNDTNSSSNSTNSLTNNTQNQNETQTPQYKEVEANENSTHTSIQDDDLDDEDTEDDNDTNTFKQNEKVQRTNKNPPIDIWTEQQQATQQIIRNNLPDYSCVFSRLNKTKMRVVPKTITIRNKLLDLLRQRNITYNTYTPSDEKMQSVLLKGTEIDDSQDIIDTLNDHGIMPHNVQRYETGHMRKNKIKSNIWQITLQPKTDTNTLTSIRYIAEWSVKWELQRKHTLTQCRRCQRFNHSASNCTLPFRCVKCTNTHEPGKCPLDSNDNKTKPSCVNCKGEHTANNARLCPVFKRQLEIKESKAKQNKKTKESATRSIHTHKSKHQHNDQTYANVTSNTTQQRQQQTNTSNQNKQNSQNDIKKLIEENQKVMHNMMQSIFDTQNKFMTALLNCNG